ncbi:hypothetical protein FGO68_gene16480 [Halteria grandinella]|uniref:Uncharacterized protein n=1 Tax=Halteria grandinella TaxID=5974 RepID=A0A8J8SZ84_HALGN|nr:hypothetical protein FGO68_gene16480 [Halteria grandinella]
MKRIQEPKPLMINQPIITHPNEDVLMPLQEESHYQKTKPIQPPTISQVIYRESQTKGKSEGLCFPNYRCNLML